MSEQSAKPNVPEGFMKDGVGRLVPVDMVKDIDKLRNETVLELVEDALKIQQQLKAFKTKAIETVHTFAEISAERYGAKIGGQKGNISLSSFDGSHRVEIQISNLIAFDEGITAAKVLVDECMHDWTLHSRPEVKAIVEGAFQADSQGQISVTRMFGLLRLDIDDEKWQRAMLAVRESMTVNGSKSYFRIKRRTDDNSKYENISLDIAGL